MKRYLVTVLMLWCIQLGFMPDLYSQDKNSVPDVQTDQVKSIHIPFGSLEKERIVGAVTALRTEDLLKYDNSQGVLGTINGRVPGIYWNRDIRGLGNAIVVIDGITRSAPGNSDRLNLADELNLLEVEEITVLRDATAKILYGAKAGQGVILITTKRGEAFKRKMKVYAEGGLKNPISYPRYLSAADYMTLYNEALVNDGLSPKYGILAINNTRDKIDPVRYPDESFYNSEYLRNNSSFFSVLTEASGGNDKARYFSSLGINSNGSIYKPHGEKKSSSENLNFRGNVDYTINKWISANLDAVAIYNANRYPNGYYGDGYGGDFFEFAATQLPNSFPVRIPANLVKDSALLKAAKLVDGQYLLGGTNQFGNNMLGNFAYGGIQSTQQKSIQLNTGLKLDLSTLLEGLTANVNFTYDFLNSYTLRQNNTYSVYEPSYVLSSTGVDSLVVTQYGTNAKRDDQTVNGNYFQRRLGLYGTLNYKKAINKDHKIDITAISYLTAVTLGASSAANYSKNKDQHFGLRANYLFKDKYVGEFSGVYVGSSYLAAKKRYALSPSVGLAWILSKEDFLSENTIINYLKLKSSYGVLNTDNTFNAYHLYNTTYSRGNAFLYNNASGNANDIMQFDAIGNPDLGFVKMKDFNIGFESALYRSKIWVEANYFNSKSTGIPVARGSYYPAYLGGLIPYENYEESSNSGIEAALKFSAVTGKFSYSIGANMVYSVPRAVKVDENKYAFDYRYKQGGVSDARFGWVAEGLFKDPADIASHATQLYGEVKPGDIKYKDLNNDGVINDDDLSQIGNSHPRAQYGLNVNLKYGNFELFLLGTAQSGSNAYKNSSYYWVFGERKYSDVVLNRWTPETADIATYPRLTTTNGSNNFRNSTYWLYDNSYFTLNNAQITYHVPAMSFWKGIQVYVRGSNLFTLAKNRELLELNVGQSPQMRYYMVGVVGSF